MTLINILALILMMSCWECSECIFSGFWTPNTKENADDFAASWLVAKNRFFLAEQGIKGAVNMAGVSFGTLRVSPRYCKECLTLMTRDYLDFFVEHLSATSNQIPFNNEDLFNITSNRLKRTSTQLRRIATRTMTKDIRQAETLAILVYSSNSFSVLKNKVQAGIRYEFFEATFWSVYRYFQNIVIFVANPQDEAEVHSMDLPYLNLTVLPTPLDVKNRTVLLPRLSLMHVMYALRETGRSNILNEKKYNYIFFTEGTRRLMHLVAVCCSVVCSLLY